MVSGRLSLETVYTVEAMQNFTAVPKIFAWREAASFNLLADISKWCIILMVK